MLGIHDYSLFVVSGALLNLAPGQDSMFIIGRSLTAGSRAGIAAALGVGVGSMCHTLGAALGLSAILAASATAFDAVKLLGAAYLIYLGIRLLRSRPQPLPTMASDASTAGAAFRQGVLTNVLNPKVALFFIAFLPQFIDHNSAHKTEAFLVLGATFITTGAIWCTVLALGAAHLRGFFEQNPHLRSLVDRATGTLFFALGIRLAWSR